MSQRILMVDDEPRILDGFRRTLRARFTIIPAASGAEGLALLREAVVSGEPFPVIVSDMMMPAMNGAQFLAQARHVDPDAVCMILSGQADLVSTISAVNNSSLFRFLTKPCSTQDLARAIEDALRQYELVQAERQLLARTLNGAVQVLTELLSLASPVGLRHTNRFRLIAEQVATEVGVSADEVWQLDLAVMLGQIGCIAVPPEVLEKADAGKELTDAEQQMIDDHPKLAADLLRRIPRLETVAAWIAEQPTALADATRAPANGHRRGTGAHDVFTATAAFISAWAQGTPPRQCVRRLVDQGGYDERIGQALLAASGGLEPRGVLRQVRVNQLIAGMVLQQDVVTSTGLTLVRQGEQLTASHTARLANFNRSVGIVEPITVLAKS